MKRSCSAAFGLSASTKRRRLEYRDTPQQTWDSSSSEDDEEKTEVVDLSLPENWQDWGLSAIEVEIDVNELKLIAQKSSEEQEQFLKSKENSPDELFVWEIFIYGKYVDYDDANSEVGLRVAGKTGTYSPLEKYSRAQIDKTKIVVKVSTAFARKCDGENRTNLLQIAVDDQIRAIFADPPNQKKTTYRPHTAKRYSFLRNGRKYLGVCLWWGQRPSRPFLEVAFYLEEPKGAGNAYEFPQRGTIPPQDILVCALGRILFVEEPDII